VDDLAAWSGWIAAVLVVAAALVPLSHRVFLGRRAAPGSRFMGGHVVIGMSASIVALLHTFALLPALGSPAAIRGGMSALGPGAAGFFLLVAHVGVGLRLRGKVRGDRARLRRRHVALAIAIGVAISAHVVALVRAG
jgi:hypothetical protein